MKKIDILLAILSGALVALAFPGSNIYCLAWLALVPLFAALDGKSLKHSFVLGFSMGLVMYLGCLRWIPTVIFHITKSHILSPLVWVISAVYPALSIGIFCALYNFMRRYLADLRKSPLHEFLYMASVPALWVTFEFLQFKLFKGVPWVYHFLGYSQTSNIRIIQILSFTSIFGLSFLIILVNLAIYRLLKEHKIKQAVAVFIILVACFLYGIWIIDVLAPREQTLRNNSVRTVVLQGNVDSLIKWRNKEETGNFIAQRYLSLNREAVRMDPDLIVWSETAIPWPIAEDDDLIEACLQITKPADAYHIIGMPSDAAEGKFYNSVFFILPDGSIIDRYDKMNLLSFTERSREKSALTGFLRIEGQPEDYVPGREHKPLRTPLGKIGVFICNESLYHDYVRGMVKRGAAFLVLVANNSLLPSDVILKYHHGINLCRAVENRRDVIVSSNVGISAFIDGYGRLIIKSQPWESACLAGSITKRDFISFYARYGDVFTYFCIFFAFLGVIVSCTLFFRSR